MDIIVNFAPAKGSSCAEMPLRQLRDLIRAGGRYRFALVHELIEKTVDRHALFLGFREQAGFSLWSDVKGHGRPFPP